MPQKSKARRRPANSRAGRPKDAGAQARSHSLFRPKAQWIAAQALTPGITYCILILITLVAYCNAWPDSLTLDDRPFVGSERFASLGLSDFARFFTEDLWKASGSESGLYRPLLLVMIAVESWVFGDWFAGYHLVTIFLHVLATVLVYEFIRRLLIACDNPPGVSASCALLAAVLFGVHPIHTEVVNSIFNSSEILVTIGVAGSLSWWFKTRPDQAARAWLGLALAYFLVLFCRESAVTLPAIAVMLLVLVSSDPWPRRLRACLPVFWLLIPLGIYLFLRAHAIDVPGAATAGAVAEQADTAGDVAGAATESAGEEIARSVSLVSDTVTIQFRGIRSALDLWFASLKHIVWPHPLQIVYDPLKTPFWLVLTSQSLLLALAVFKWIKGRPGLLVGLAFFYLAIIPSSRLLGSASSSPGLADRLLYLPSVGLTIAAAFGFSFLAQRFKLRIAVVSAIFVTLIFLPLTIQRNADWKSDLALYASDYPKLKDRGAILNTYLSALLRENQVVRAVELCDLHAEALLARPGVGVQCGAAYGLKGRFADAEKAYLSVSRNRDSLVYASFNLAMMYLHLGRRSEAEEYFAKAIEKEREPFLKEYFTAVMLIYLHPNDHENLLEAKAHLEKALEIQPQHVESRAELKRLNERLSPKAKGH